MWLLLFSYLAARMFLLLSLPATPGCLSTLLKSRFISAVLEHWCIPLQRGACKAVAGRGEMPEMLQVNVGVRAVLTYLWASGEAAALPVQCSLSSLAQLQSQGSFFSLKTVPFPPGREHQHILPHSCSTSFNKMPL